MIRFKTDFVDECNNIAEGIMHKLSLCLTIILYYSTKLVSSSIYLHYIDRGATQTTVDSYILVGMQTHLTYYE